jgi:hypothetical protein
MNELQHLGGTCKSVELCGVLMSHLLFLLCLLLLLNHLCSLHIRHRLPQPTLQLPTPPTLGGLLHTGAPLLSLHHWTATDHRADQRSDQWSYERRGQRSDDSNRRGGGWGESRGGVLKHQTSCDQYMAHTDHRGDQRSDRWIDQWHGQRSNHSDGRVGRK